MVDINSKFRAGNKIPRLIQLKGACKKCIYRTVKIHSVKAVKRYLQVRLIHSLSKRPTKCPLWSSVCSKTTGTSLIPCLFIVIKTERRSILGVAVHETWHFSPSEHISDTNSSWNSISQVSKITCMTWV